MDRKSKNWTRLRDLRMINAYRTSVGALVERRSGEVFEARAFSSSSRYLACKLAGYNVVGA